MKGFIHNLDFFEYQKIDALNKSRLDLMARSPKHFLAYQVKKTLAMKLGSALHTAFLEPSHFQKEYVTCYHDKRSKEYKDLLSTHDPEFILTQSEKEKIDGMIASLKDNALINKLFSQIGDVEVSLVTQDKETGLKCKCRYDFLTQSGIAIDLKKTTDARPENFSKSVYNFGYHRQAAFYDHLFYQETRDHLQAFLFVCVEDEFPFNTNVFMLDDPSFALGLESIKRDMKKVLSCQKSGIWQGYSKEIEMISLPPWAFKEEALK